MFTKPLAILGAFLLIIVLSFPAAFELFKPGYFTNHDGEGHIIRFEEFDRALEDGHFPPRLSKNLMYGYGFYFFNFNYPLVHWLGQTFHETGLDYTDSVKAVSVFGIVASGVTMYLWQRNRWGELGGITAAVFYMYAPYRLMNVYVRGSLAEHLAFVSIPVVFMMVENIAISGGKKQLRYTLLGALAYAVLLLSHNIMAFIFTLMMGLFILYQLAITAKVKLLVNYAVMGIMGMMMTAFFWIPSLYEKQYVRLDQTIGQDFPDHFVYLRQLFERTWGYGGSGPGLNDGLSLQVGVYHLLMLAVGVAAVFLLYSKKKAHKANYIIFFLGIFLLSVFFMVELSKPIWQHVPLFAFTQFPWRYLSWSVFASSIVTGGVIYTLSTVPRYKLLPVFTSLALMGLLISSSSEYWLPNQRVTIAPIGDRPIPGSTTWADEQFPKWFEPKPSQEPIARVETFPLAEVSIVSWKTADHEYFISTNVPITVVENTAYYPGWQVEADGQSIPVDYQNVHFPGRLVYELEPGDHNIKSKFKETPFRLSMDIISVITLTAASGLLAGTYFAKDKRRGIIN